MTFRVSRKPSLIQLGNMKRLRQLCQKLNMQMSLAQFQAFEAARLKARIEEAARAAHTARQSAKVSELEIA